MNKIILLGRLTRDPEIRYSQGENSMAIARFTLAVNRRYKRQGEPEADFFNCTAFGKQAEFIQNYLKQGTQILVFGRVQNDNYTNKEGQKVYSVQIMVEEIDFAGSKGNSEAGTQQQATPQTDNNGFMTIPEGLEEELPFA
jgi:single-strand DNA-binding protein